jgi:hypothetical protein
LVCQDAAFELVDSTRAGQEKFNFLLLKVVKLAKFLLLAS